MIKKKIKLTPDQIYERGGQEAIHRFWQIQGLPKEAAVGGGDVYYFTHEEVLEIFKDEVSSERALENLDNKDKEK